MNATKDRLVERVEHLREIRRSAVMPEYLQVPAPQLIVGDRIRHGGRTYTVTAMLDMGAEITVEAEFAMSFLHLTFSPLEAVAVQVPRPPAANRRTDG